MLPINVIREHGESLENFLKLQTFPLGIKLLKKEKDIPKEAKRPKKDYGYRFITCQGFSESRRSGEIIAQTKDDMWCFEAAMGYGFIEPVDYFLEGNTRFPESISTLEAGRFWAQHFPCLEYGKYSAIVSAPLAKINFEPDVVIIYCDSIQLTQLLCARTWIDGYEFTSRMSGHAACVHSILPVMQTGECQVSFPCVGDRRRAWASNDEIIFSTPLEKVEGLIQGLNCMKKYGAGLPLVPSLPHEPEMHPSYMKMAKITGMHE